MKSKLSLLVFFLVTTLYSLAQTPQNVTQLDDSEKDSLWNSTSAIIFVAILILLLIVGRTWSKKVHEKRDELSNKDKD